MGLKLSKPELIALHFIKDFSLEPQTAVGAVSLGDLPDGFVIQSIRVQELVALTATTTIALGEDGGGDADGYLVAVDPAASQRGAGALLYDATDKHYNESVVDPAKDGLLLTTAVAAAVAGKICVIVQGFQSF
jgi:hypothetical protein